MNLTIECMTIENFKGTKSMTVDFGVGATHIYGRNGTGKTTIPDAFSWVLFNKDSHGNAPGSDAFREKPLDADGREIHNLTTAVTLFCKVDGAPFTLKRVQNENWVKPRGRAEAAFQGNVSQYYINDVETKLNDFKARVNSIAAEDVFRLIATMSAFNSDTEWKKQRQVLVSLSGGNVDVRLFEREEYAQIFEEIKSRGVTVDELRKIVVDQRKRMNQEIGMIPARIDEVQRMKPTFGEHEVEDAEYNVREAQTDMAKIDGYIAELRAKDGSASKRDEIISLENELLSIKRRANDDFFARKRRAETARENANADMRRYTAAVSDTQHRIDDAEKRKAEIEKQRDALRTEYRSVYDTNFDVDVPQQNTVCPTCGQQLPESQLREAYDKARMAFLETRKAKLSKIQSDGAKCNDNIEMLNTEADRLRAEITDMKSRIDEARSALNKAVDEIVALPTEIDYTVDERYVEVVRQIEAARAGEAAMPDTKIKQFEDRRAELGERLKRAQAVIAKRDALVDSDKRIEELEARQKELGAQYADAEQMLMRIEQFITDRCAALEESINDKFPTVRWKLFNQQINGGIEDTCCCMIYCNGSLVPYKTANTAARLNADIEVINVLSEHYGVTVPLFFDNKERVNCLCGVNGQLITLSVSTDEALRVETNEREAA